MFDNLTDLIRSYIDATARPRFKRGHHFQVNLTKDGFVYMTDIQGRHQGYPEGLVKQLRISPIPVWLTEIHTPVPTRGLGLQANHRNRPRGPMDPHFRGSITFPSLSSPWARTAKPNHALLVRGDARRNDLVGCHEPQDSVSRQEQRQASRKPPCPMEPWLGQRGFGLTRKSDGRGPPSASAATAADAPSA